MLQPIPPHQTRTGHPLSYARKWVLQRPIERVLLLSTNLLVCVFNLFNKGNLNSAKKESIAVDLTNNVSHNLTI